MESRPTLVMDAAVADRSYPLKSLSLTIKDRRRRYLESHPEYFTDPLLELADPLLYDRTVRQFQSAAERQEDGRRKGYSGKLEADLTRSEAKIEALAQPHPNDPLAYRRDDNGTIYAVEFDAQDRPQDKEEGLRMWKEAMAARFLRGDDDDFDYDKVDGNPEYDDTVEDLRRNQDRYFDDEDEEIVDGLETQGQTGVQDF